MCSFSLHNVSVISQGSLYTLEYLGSKTVTEEYSFSGLAQFSAFFPQWPFSYIFNHWISETFFTLHVQISGTPATCMWCFIFLLKNETGFTSIAIDFQNAFHSCGKESHFGCLHVDCLEKVEKCTSVFSMLPNSLEILFYLSWLAKEFILKSLKLL